MLKLTKPPLNTADYDPTTRYFFCRTRFNPEVAEIMPTLKTDPQYTKAAIKAIVENDCNGGPGCGLKRSWGEHEENPDDYIRVTGKYGHVNAFWKINLSGVQDFWFEGKKVCNRNIIDHFEEYLAQKCTTEEITHRNYLSFDADYQSRQRHDEARDWPTVHVLEGEENLTKFKSLVNDLTGQEVSDDYAGYHDFVGLELGFIAITKKQPLILEDRVWSMKGDDLNNAIDFLSTPIYRYISTSMY